MQHWFRVQLLLAAKGVASRWSSTTPVTDGALVGSVQFRARGMLSLRFSRCRSLSGPYRFPRCSGFRWEVESQRQSSQIFWRMDCCSVRLSHRYEAQFAVSAYREILLQGVVPNIWRAEGCVANLQSPSHHRSWRKGSAIFARDGCGMKALCGPRDL